jgi:hypothetical protein
MEESVIKDIMSLDTRLLAVSDEAADSDTSKSMAVGLNDPLV